MQLSRLRLLATQDRVLVEVLPDPVHSLDAGDPDSPLIIPEAHRRFSRRGKVRAIGVGHFTRKGAWVPTQVRRGDVVHLPVVSPETPVYNIGGREHRIVRERDILAVIDA